MRIRQHVNPLKSNYHGRAVPPLALPRSGEVEVELGCADAQFLFERAVAHPAIWCVGLEIRRDLVDEVNQRARALGLQNLTAEFAHVNEDLDRLLPDGRLARAYLNFPDPWFKRRHHKRRVVTPELADVLTRKLVPGGELLFQSDVWDLALDALATFEAEPALENARGPWSFLRDDHGYGARSFREARCLARDEPIWRILYRRR